MHPTDRHNAPASHHWLLVTCLLSGLLSGLWPAAALALEAAARVQFAVGDLTATSSSGEVRTLAKGDEVYTGDVIDSGADGSAQLIFRDRSRMAVRVNTRFAVENYSYNEADESASRSIFRLFKGALRSITGLIGARDHRNVSIHTPVATIGVRGTDHEVVHLPPETAGQGGMPDPGTYNRVYAGATTMRTLDGQLINLGINDVGFIGALPGRVSPPVKLRALPPAIEKMLINKVPMTARDQGEHPKMDREGKRERRQLAADPQGLRQRAVNGTDPRAEPLPGGLLPSAEPVLDASRTLLPTTEPVLDTTRTLLPTTEPVLDTTRTLLPTTEPVLDTTRTLLPTIEPVLDTTRTLLPTIEPVLDTTRTLLPTTEPVLDTTRILLPTLDPSTTPLPDTNLLR